MTGLAYFAIFLGVMYVVCVGLVALVNRWTDDE